MTTYIFSNKTSLFPKWNFFGLRISVITNTLLQWVNFKILHYIELNLMESNFLPTSSLIILKIWVHFLLGKTAFTNNQNKKAYSQYHRMTWPSLWTMQYDLFWGYPSTDSQRYIKTSWKLFLSYDFYLLFYCLLKLDTLKF